MSVKKYLNPRGREPLFTAASVLVLAALLAALDGRGFWFQGWTAYSLVLGLALAGVLSAWRLSAAPDQPSPRQLGLAGLAFGLRLIVGIGLMALLPAAGYADNAASQAGYFYKDAYFRDTQAWTLAGNSASILTAFSGRYTSDQYGGLLALSAALYRYLSPAVHRPGLMLVLTAAAGAMGVLFLWHAARLWSGERVASLAAWIFILYPEGLLLGSTHMREAFVLPAVALTVYCLARSRSGKHWLLALALAAAVLVAIQPLAALAALGVFMGAWLLDPARRLSRSALLISVVMLLSTLAVVFLAWANLPSLQGLGPLEIFAAWIRNNFNYQSYVLERASGIVQKLLDSVSPGWGWLIFIVYGIAQPVLPAVAGDPQAALFWRVIGFLRAAGWYALAPLLVYALFSAFRSSPQDHGLAPKAGFLRKLDLRLVWLNLAFWGWTIISALNAGGDQWDNPRYRVMLLPWAAYLAAWGWNWANLHRDAWLKRWLAVEAVFVLSFTEWYITRYTLRFAHLDIQIMIVLNLAAAGLILGRGWWVDRKKSSPLPLPTDLPDVH